jgi:hypothetical protein
MGDLIGGIASSLIGGVANLFGTQQTNQANTDIANSANQFSAQQFATRYQTTVKDLQAAGLNPMLAYSQGGGSPPTAQMPAPRQNAIGNASNSALAAFDRTLQAKNVEADVLLKKQQAETASAQEKVNQTQAIQNIANEAKINQDTRTSAAVEQVNRKQLDAIAAEIDLKKASTVSASAAAARQNVETLRQAQEMQIRKPEEAKSQTWWGKHVSPYLSDFSRGASSAVSASQLAK